jgi:hypothetical protein
VPDIFAKKSRQEPRKISVSSGKGLLKHNRPFASFQDQPVSKRKLTRAESRSNANDLAAVFLGLHKLGGEVVTGIAAAQIEQ